MESSNSKIIIFYALWFGLLTGLIEGIGLFIFQKQGWLSGKLSYLGAGPEILWVSPLMNLILFTGIGSALLGAAYLLPRAPVVMISIFIYSTLLWFDFLAMPLSGRLSIIAYGLLAVGISAQQTRLIYKNPTKVSGLINKTLPWIGITALFVLFAVQGGSWVREKIASSLLPDAPQGSPNVLVIIIDTLRADHLSSYGYQRSTSPNIDKLAKEGVLFENTYATSSWTPPSHASILTGRWTFEHGAEFLPLDDKYPTIGEELSKIGYRTGAFSGNFGMFNRQRGFGRGFMRFEDHYWSPKNYLVESLYGRFIEYYILHKVFGMKYKFDRKLAEDVNKSVIDWIDDEQEIPFFVFINYNDVHAPYVPPQPFRSAFSDKENPGGITNSDWDNSEIYVLESQEQLQDEIDAYDGAIKYVDHQIGLLLKMINQLGMLDNTLVLVTSDHGEFFGEHDLLQHSNALYVEGIQVPLIMRWVGNLPANRRIEHPVSIASIPTTIMQAVSQKESESFPIPSLYTLINTSPDNKEWPLPLAELGQISDGPYQNPSTYGALKSVITSQYQYIVHEEYGEELYDIVNDPNESSNMVDGQNPPTELGQLRDYLDTIIQSITILHQLYLLQ